MRFLTSIAAVVLFASTCAAQTYQIVPTYRVGEVIQVQPSYVPAQQPVVVEPEYPMLRYWVQVQLLQRMMEPRATQQKPPVVVVTPGSTIIKQQGPLRKLLGCEPEVIRTEPQIRVIRE